MTSCSINPLYFRLCRKLCFFLKHRCWWQVLFYGYTQTFIVHCHDRLCHLSHTVTASTLFQYLIRIILTRTLYSYIRMWLTENWVEHGTEMVDLLYVLYVLHLWLHKYVLNMWFLMITGCSAGRKTYMGQNQENWPKLS